MDAFSAADTFFLIDNRNAILIIRDRINRTAEFARSFQVSDGIVRTGVSALAALFTFCRINMGACAPRLDRAEFTGIDTSLSYTVLAVLRNYVTGDRTVLTS